MLQKKQESSESVEIFAPVSLATLQTVLKCAFSYSEDIQQSVSGYGFYIILYSSNRQVVTNFSNLNLKILCLSILLVLLSDRRIHM